MAVPGLDLLDEIAQGARQAPGGARRGGALRARVVLLARGESVPPGVVADRVVVASDDVMRKARGPLAVVGRLSGPRALPRRRAES